MQIQVLKSKIHRATVTQAEHNYIGSITIDEQLMIDSDAYILPNHHFIDSALIVLLIIINL